MTSRGDNLETNEFLRLRKLRLQQVREQSKDIAKKIRQRAKAEQLRQVTNVDANKEKVYLQRQGQLVKRLEQLYAKGLENVGAGHKNASELNKKCKTDNPVKTDIAKLRGKEAVAELRRKKQEKLDEQKKLLDRKLQAREAANELSREKSVIVNNILAKSSSSKNLNEASDKATNATEKVTNIEDNGEQNQKDKSDAVTKNDMGTQWDFEEVPNEWEPNIPSLSIPQDDSAKNFASDNAEKTDKSKRLNLFALSDEMPSSLRGGITSIPQDRLPLKPSLTAVSEFLQNRGLRLREPDIVPQKKSSDDLKSIKQTLLRTRASRTDGTVISNVCHVLDEQVIPVPCWQAQNNCEFCSLKYRFPQHCKNTSNNFATDKCSTFSPVLEDYSLRLETLKSCTRSHKCHTRHRIPVSGRSNHIEHSVRSAEINSDLTKKNSVTMYDHNTRDIRAFPQNAENIVVRDQGNDEDAYSQALKASSVAENGDKVNHKVHQETRNRIAMTKQNVEKEYRDTLAFLNSLPKERNAKPIRTAFMDGERQQEMKERHQQRLQQEYKKVEKECSKHHGKHSKYKTTCEHRSNKSKSPLRMEVDNNNVISRDFQYSWLPVPESDGSLAIHTVSSNTKERPGNSVKFSSVDTYHEYRSRHKHTPPTKDEPQKKVVIMQENSNDSISSSCDTDTSSVENLQVKQDHLNSHRVNRDHELADAERIIIYKVMESNKDKKHKKHKTKKNKIRDETQNDDELKTTSASHLKPQSVSNNDVVDNIPTNNVSFTQLKEGVYKSVSANGLCSNVLRCFTNVDYWHSSIDRKPWWDNIASMYFSEDQPGSECNKHNLPYGKDTGTLNEIGDNSSNRNVEPSSNCKCKNNTAEKQLDKHPSAATSTSSFKTAVNDRNNSPEGGYIKFVDDGGQDAGKFYVGASGFLKDDAYEVVIQLRKKEVERNKMQPQDTVQSITPIAKNIETNDVVQQSTEDKTTNVNTSSKMINAEIHQNRPVEEQAILESPIDINVAPPQSLVQNDDKLSAQSVTNNSKPNIPTVEPSNVSDKAVCTSFRDSFAIPDNVPKSDTVPKPATTTYTQTTDNSPITRPVLMHLSSSTSTTYMSPPELVLPRYFRNASVETNGETYDRVSSNLNSQYSKPKCKTHGCRKCNKHSKKTTTDTPPNSTRSTDHTEDTVDNKNCENYLENENINKKMKSHNCKKQSQHKICSKQKFKRNQNGSTLSTLKGKRSKMVKNPSKSNLNPVIENYVKKLLALNKEGLMAIEVINQECSGVNTPGSSIIEVPSNIKNNKSMVHNKISLEQVKESLKEQILKNIEGRKLTLKRNLKTTGSQTDRNLKSFVKSSSRKRPVHKVKSLNISKHFTKTNKESRQSAQSTIITASPVSVYSRKEKSSQVDSSIEVPNLKIKIVPTPKRMKIRPEYSNNTSNSDTNNYFIRPRQRSDKGKTSHSTTKINTVPRNYPNKSGKRSKLESCSLPTHRATTTSQSSESDMSLAIRNQRKLTTPPISISTQTNQVDSEVEFMKLAENKLQNMEKIADLTEKCTKRLSNLAKVLEEVRKNKSLAYSQISTSDTTSDTDQRSDKLLPVNDNRIHNFNPTVEIQTLSKALSSLPTSPNEQKEEDSNNPPEYVPILVDIPKPDTFKTPSPRTGSDNSNIASVLQKPFGKSRTRPPPALTRVHLKNVTDDFVIPHELSTVVEVDSPMSVKFKNNTTYRDTKHDASPTESADSSNGVDRTETHGEILSKTASVDPKSKNISKEKHKTQSADSSDESKIKMMDLKQFNEIMLKPFISLQDYAKQHNLIEPDDGSINQKMSKAEHEELSSLHSDASIPDVMAELLKRNLISEPFKFETTSATVSSESTLSMLALSRAGKNKKKPEKLLKNKENIAETSESLSISSNPDLEHAFQRLGMGWASSTLKKTKERLALSSSSNTSSSSMPLFKIKSFNYQDVPEISKDSIMSLLNISNKDELTIPQQSKTAKSALQQTSITNSMTVKEFLANELAKKITFSNKSNRDTIEDEFISLCETKMPDEMKLLAHKSAENEKSVDSGVQSNAGGSINRARTSTPVQIFKSMTYHSTSSSNTSNGLFSNADDLSSVKVTSNSNKNHSTSDKDDLTIPNYSLKIRKGLSDCSKSD